MAMHPVIILMSIQYLDSMHLMLIQNEKVKDHLISSIHLQH